VRSTVWAAAFTALTLVVVAPIAAAVASNSAGDGGAGTYTIVDDTAGVESLN